MCIQHQSAAIYIDLVSVLANVPHSIVRMAIFNFAFVFAFNSLSVRLGLAIFVYIFCFCLYSLVGIFSNSNVYRFTRPIIHNRRFHSPRMGRPICYRIHAYTTIKRQTLYTTWRVFAINTSIYQQQSVRPNQIDFHFYYYYCMLCTAACSRILHSMICLSEWLRSSRWFHTSSSMQLQSPILIPRMQ